MSINSKGDDVLVVVTNGQSWADLARQFTDYPEYELNIAAYNNMLDQSISGKRYRIEIPTGWLKAGVNTGGGVELPAGGGEIIKGIPNWALVAAAVASVVVLMK